MASLTEKFKRLYGRSPKGGEILFSGGIGYQYSGGMWRKIGKTTIQTKATTAPVNIEDKQKKATEIKQRINEIQSRIQAIQRVVKEAQTKGIKPNEPIPADILAKEPSLADLVTREEKRSKYSFDDIETASQNLLKDITQQLSKYREEKEEAEKEMKEWRSKIEKLIEERRERIEDYIEEQRKKYEIPETYQRLQAIIPEIDTLNQKLIDLKKEEEMQLLKAEQKLAPMAIIRGEQALIQRQYASLRAAVAAELSAKTAIAEMYRGNIELAESLIQKSVNALVYDTEQKLNDYKYLFDYYSDYIETLDSKTRGALNKIYSLLQDKLETEKEEYELKVELYRDLVTDGVYVDFNDFVRKPIDEALDYYGQQVQEIAEIVDVSDYFSPNQLRQLRRVGIDPTTPEGFKKALEMFPPETEKWEKAENYIIQNIKTYGAEVDMAGIYATLTAPPPKGAGLSSSDAYALMAQYGMVKIGGIWVYASTEIPTTGIETPTTGTEKTKETKKPWWRRVASEIWHRLPFVK